ncbi:MAG: U32 family peptidase [Thermoanaerobacteraceae bacterium]|nr:U32 family peptidase [Thermoanaerobacteraceae bacterium]
MEGRVELMAPAGSEEALRAAVANGADAVYLGGRQFNARQYAENFTLEGIREAVAYAHEHGVKIYVTVNTLLKEEELEPALCYLYALGESRVDGVIVQDLGLAREAHRLLPDLPLIGSTQMTVTDAAGAKLLEKMGFKRVVLARELSLEDIGRIRQECALELEVFVHGALCYSYSGQCLLSSLVGGRSGNRGRCAQPCRLAYTLVDEGGREVEAASEHLLSTRDLCTLEMLPLLISSGVNAFKIEGRMRRPEYVAVVTRAYRRAIDRFLENPWKFAVDPEEARDIAQIFNRDFTSGYLLGDPGSELMSYGRPSNRGIFLGRILAREKGGLYRVKLEVPLKRGDGVEVWVRRGGHPGMVISEIRMDGRPVDEAPAGSVVCLALPPTARPGDRLFKTSDAELLRRVRRGYTSPREGRKIPVNMEVWAAPGEPLRLRVTDPQGRAGEAVAPVPSEPARKHPLTVETLRAQLDRLGNTPYELKQLKAHIQGKVMVPLSVINGVRREAVSGLAAARLASWPRPVPSREEFEKALEEGAIPEAGRRVRPAGAPAPGLPRLAVAVRDLEGARAAAEAGADRIYLGGDVWQGGEAPPPAEVARLGQELARRGIELLPALPRLWHEVEGGRVRRRLEKLLEVGIRQFLVANLGGLWLVKELGATGWGDYPLNVFNSSCVQTLSLLGLGGVTLSPELNLDEIKGIYPFLPLEVIVHGSLPLAVSAHCVLGARLGGKGPGKRCSAPCRRETFGLKDRLGLVFPITTDVNCRFYLYNPKTLDFLEHMGLLQGVGLSFVRLEVRNQGAPYIRRVTALYRQALFCLDKGDREALPALAGELRELVGEHVTRGHYFRGVS